jgi:cytochrome oxidase Cu insertion factor (SCO1/SenC/PrrC family)
MTEIRSLRRNRMLLVGLFAIAIVPLAGAFWLYQSSRSAEPWATTNHGELLNPIISVSDLNLHAVDGAESMINSGHWWLVAVARDGCADECQHAVHQLRQLHILLARDATRVKRSLVAIDGEPPDASLAKTYPELVLFTGAANVLRAGVYIVDPLGNLVLHYEFNDAGKSVLADLKQLLKVSHIG